LPGGLLSDLRIAIGIRRRGDRVRFVFPGDVAVTPGQSYAIRVSSRVTFGWKYAVGGYERGAATFNGRPLVTGTRTTFLFRTLGSN
jgi:hypothetical protein